MLTHDPKPQTQLWYFLGMGSSLVSTKEINGALIFKIKWNHYTIMKFGYKAKESVFIFYHIIHIY